MNYLPGTSANLPGQQTGTAHLRLQHSALQISDGVATVTLNRPDRKNP
jgi:hypothetical protein